jgi:anti-sigma factor RsiW
MREFWSRVRFWRDHRWAPRRMSAYLDGELAARWRSRMERHVGECVECRRVVTGLRQVVAILRRLPAPEGGGDASRIAASVRAQITEAPS